MAKLQAVSYLEKPGMIHPTNLSRDKLRFQPFLSKETLGNSPTGDFRRGQSLVWGNMGQQERRIHFR